MPLEKARQLPLPYELKLKIKQMAVKKALRKQKFIMTFFNDLAQVQVGYHQSGMPFTWEIFYNYNLECPSIPLERSNCRCKLKYSIVRCCLNLENYTPLSIIFEGQEIELTQQLILDYDPLYQIVVTDPDQTDYFGRKIANCILNLYIQNSKKIYIEIHIISKPPEWDITGVRQAQHSIL